MLAGELYPVPSNDAKELKQEQLLRAVMDQWYDSEVKTDPDVMLRTLDAIHSILGGTLGMPDHVRQAVERAEQKKRKAEAEEAEELARLVQVFPFPGNPDPMILLLEEIRALRHAVRELKPSLCDAVSDEEA